MYTKYQSVLLSLVLTSLGLLPAFGADTRECNEINWRPQILAGFEDIDKACMEVVTRDDKSYVRFEVKLVRLLSDGNVKVSMRLQDGTRVERVFHAPSDFQILSHTGRTTFNFEQLNRGDILDVYIPLSRIVGAKLGQETV